MIETIINPVITKELYSIFELDIDGEVHNKETVNTLYFDYPNVEYFKPIFMDFIIKCDFQFLHITVGSNIKTNQEYLKVNKQSFIRFIETKEKFYSKSGLLYEFEGYEALGISLFDDSFEWFIHCASDIYDITFSYQIEKFKNLEALEILKSSKWYCGEGYLDNLEKEW